VPYKRLWNRSKGSKPKSENGGNHTLLTPVEEAVLLAWANTQLSSGISPKTIAVVRSANWLMQHASREPRATKKWARVWMKRHDDIFKLVRTKARCWGREVAQDRAMVLSTIVDMSIMVPGTSNNYRDSICLLLFGVLRRW
jgi:hypothetical protein